MKYKTSLGVAECQIQYLSLFISQPYHLTDVQIQEFC